MTRHVQRVNSIYNPIGEILNFKNFTFEATS